MTKHTKENKQARAQAKLERKQVRAERRQSRRDNKAAERAAESRTEEERQCAEAEGRQQRKQEHALWKQEKKERKTVKKEFKEQLKGSGLSKEEAKEAKRIYKKTLKDRENASDKSVLSYAAIAAQIAADKATKEACKSYPGIDGKLISSVPQTVAKSLTLAANIYEEQQKGNQNPFKDAVVRTATDSAVDAAIGAIPGGQAILAAEVIAPHTEKYLEPLKEELATSGIPRTESERIRRRDIQESCADAAPGILIGKTVGALREFANERTKALTTRSEGPKPEKKTREHATGTRERGFFLERESRPSREFSNKVDKSRIRVDRQLAFRKQI